jgi:eukaryotic-like serine/threonine-protein kinase
MTEPDTLKTAPRGIPSPGEIFARKYRIERVLGVGGMGAVLAAQHIHLEERVAIKVMLPEMALDPGTTKRFLREAKAAVKIKGDHVAKVQDFGETESGQPYIVMEYLVGESLDAALERRGRLSVVETADYLLQASDAIAQAHALGIVHRDIKPPNLFLTTREDGSIFVKVLDFGISKASASSPASDGLHLTKTQSLVGSPMYMAPEQMRPNGAIDPRTDIWALGVVAYELLTGKVPFDGQSVTELCALVLMDEPKAPRTVRPDIPAGLEAIILRCLQKKPDDRYPNLAAMANALAPFASREAVDHAARISRALKVREGELAVALHATVKSDAAQAAPKAPKTAVAEFSPGAPPAVKTSAAWSGIPSSADIPKRSSWPLVVGAVALAAGAAGATLFFIQRSSPSNASMGAASSAQTGASPSPSTPSLPPPSPPETTAPARAEPAAVDHSISAPPPAPAPTAATSNTAAVKPTPPSVPRTAASARTAPRAPSAASDNSGRASSQHE